MAISRISGNILQDNLQRGANLSIQGNLIYFDVDNNRVGIKTSDTSHDLTVAGNLLAGNITIDTNTISGLGNISIIPAVGSNIFVGNINIKDLADPVDAQDAATKNYVDTSLSSVFTFEDDATNTTTVADGDTVLMSGTANEVDVVVGNLSITFGLPNDVTIGNTLTVTANLDVGNINATANITAIGNIQGGNIISDGAVIGNVSISGNLVVANLVVQEYLTGNIVNISNTVTVGGNITGGNIISNAGIFGSTADVSGNIAGGNVSSNGQITATGNITGGNVVSNASISAATTISATGNVTGGNIISNAGIFGTTANLTGNIFGGNISTSGQITATGNITGGNLVSNAGIFGSTANISGNVSVGNLTIDSTTADRILYTDTNKNVTTTNNLTFNGSALVLTGTANISGNTLVGNLYSAAVINAVGNITGDNIIANANVNANNINISKELFVSGNAVIDGNLAVNGDLIYENVTTLAIEDPIISMGRGANNTPLTTNDGKDRGEQLWYYSSSEKSAFIGYDNSAGNLIGAIDVTIANEIVTVNQFGTWQVGNIYAESALIVGNVSFGNISTSGQITATGNITGGNLISNAAVSATTTIDATGNITGGNLVSNAAVSATTTIDATGNITGGNLISNAAVSAATTVSATGNITGGNLVSNAAVSATTTIDATGNITGGNLISNASVSAATTVSATGNITGGNLVSNANISAASFIFATSNIVGGNIISNARIVGTTLQINGDGLIAGNLTVQGNLTYINVEELRVEDPILQLGAGANGNALISNDGKDRGTLLTYYTTAQGNAFMGWDNSSGNMIISSNVTVANEIVSVNSFGTLEVGNIYAESADIIGNVSFGNISTSGQISATGNITGGNLVSNAAVSAATTVSATGNITGGNLVSNANINAATAIFANGNITGGNVISNAFVSAVTTISANGNITGGNLVSNSAVSASTTIDATGNVTGGNLVSNASVSAATTISATGNVAGGNIVSNALVTGANVQVSTLTANRVVYVGTDSYLVDSANFTFDGTTANIQGQLIVDNFTINGTAITSNANVTLTATTGNLVLIPASAGVTQISSTTALTIPTGNTAQRPGSPDQGALRFNTNTLLVEVYDGTEWDVVGQDLVDITSQIINGDGATSVFALNETATSDSILVSINGVSQVPVFAYSVTGNVITFTEAPSVADQIEIRFISQLQVVTEISNSAGNAIVNVSDATSQVNITGNLLPTANVTYDLGNTTLRWNDLYLAGNSIYLGNVILTNQTGNAIGFFAADGTTPATISSGGGLDVGTGNLSVGNIFNNNANGVGNIGSSGTYFNTIFAKATSAQYADLAEYFAADGAYQPGWVMIFAGDSEVTESYQYADQRLAGVISTDPAYVMNAGQAGVPIAMAGRVPCWVVGPVVKGDVLTTSGRAGHAEKLADNDWRPGVIVGKALETCGAGPHKIMIVIGAW